MSIGAMYRSEIGHLRERHAQEIAELRARAERAEEALRRIVAEGTFSYGEGDKCHYCSDDRFFSTDDCSDNCPRVIAEGALAQAEPAGRRGVSCPSTPMCPDCWVREIERLRAELATEQVSHQLTREALDSCIASENAQKEQLAAMKAHAEDLDDSLTVVKSRLAEKDADIAAARAEAENANARAKSYDLQVESLVREVAAKDADIARLIAEIEVRAKVGRRGADCNRHMVDEMKCKNCDCDNVSPEEGFCSRLCATAYPRRNEEERQKTLEEVKRALGVIPGVSPAVWDVIADLIEPNHTAGLQGVKLAPLGWPLGEEPPKFTVKAVLGPDTIKVERVR